MRLTVFGHILRLNPETPALLQYYVTPYRRPVKRPPLLKKNTIFRAFSGVCFIHKLKNDVFVHDFLSHQTSELPEIWNLSKHWTNLKNNEDRFSKFAFLPFFMSVFRFFCR